MKDWERGGIEKWAFMPGLCKRVWTVGCKEGRTEKFSNISPHDTTHSNERLWGVILRRICWGTPALPPPFTRGLSVAEKGSQHGSQGGGRGCQLPAKLTKGQKGVQRRSPE